jgi:hypothetical protein
MIISDYGTERKIMAKRGSQKRSDSAPRVSRGKSDAEARVERITWALLVLVFAILEIIPSAAILPNWFIPLAGAVVLLGSGFYQYSRGWRVSPITWLAGGLLMFFGVYNMTRPQLNFLGLSLLVFAGVILAGVFTNET